MYKKASSSFMMETMLGDKITVHCFTGEVTGFSLETCKNDNRNHDGVFLTQDEFQVLMRRMNGLRRDLYEMKYQPEQKLLDVDEKITWKSKQWFGVRERNLLSTLGLSTLREISETPRERFLECKGAGPTTIRRIAEALQAHGLHSPL